MSIVYTAQSSLELEQHAFLSTEGAMKNTRSEGAGRKAMWTVRHLILTSSSRQDALPRAGSVRRPWKFLEVAWDSEGAWVLELLLGILALRMELSLHRVSQAWNTSRRGDDRNAPLSNPVTSCHLS